jgi:type II secretory pathway pseudopilin PulG
LKFEVERLEEEKMGNNTRDSRGFTLIAALLLTLLLSALAIGLLYLVTNEQHFGNNDLEGNVAYYGAEAGMESLTAQLSQLYQTSQNPTASSLCALVSASNYPTAISGSNITSTNYVETITWPPTPSGSACPSTNPTSSWDIVGAGADQGMVASLVPFNLQVTATRATSAGEVTTNSAISPTGASVNLTRTVEVALLPAFEFGIFCSYDCDYFAGPNFNFGGRVHTNNNLFLASDANLTFTNKITAVGQVITTQLENGWPTSTDYTGNIYVPSATGGCPNAPGTGPATNCNLLTAGSWTGGFPPTGAANSSWKGISTDSPTGSPAGFNGFITTGLTGATALQLPFVQASPVGSIEIIRRPQASDSQQLTNSRLYSEASIRILLADTEADLYPGSTRSDAATQDIQIGTPFTHANQYVSVPTVETGNGVTAGYMYFATAKPHATTNNWTTNPPTGCSTTLTSWPLFGQVTATAATTPSGTPCQGAWLRVEYLNNSGNWVGVTTQWLGYGFGRSYNAPPTHPYSTSTTTAPYCPSFNTTAYATGQCQNGISPAILILQQLQYGEAASKATETDTTDSSSTAYNWIPINFYDAREGEPRDSRPTGDPGTDCSPTGIMNAVELDVGNLWLWLQGVAPYTSGSGPLVNFSNYNGYILYFMDNRGMIPDKYPLLSFYNGYSGMSGLNDVVNSGSAVGVPDGVLEPITYYATATPTPYSPEDTAIKGTKILGTNVDNWGEANLGAGFGIAAASMNEPYYIYGSVTSNAVQCFSGTAAAPTTGTATAEWNMVTGPRHVLRLVDGGMSSSGSSFLPPTGSTTNGNGFTVASNNPVYVWGNYNTGSNDPFWPSENTTTAPHSAAAIIADTVTLLSNPPTTVTTPTTKVGWTDQESFIYPATADSRPGNTSYYRMAIAAGKTIPFPQPAFAAAVPWKDFGTDGGMHNFLRYLEDRSDGGNGGTVNYAGSMISMYYSQYNTGIFKCCNAVYGAPTRNYFFDTQFLNPANLPPGTPMFQDVVSLSYHQTFTPQ